MKPIHALAKLAALLMAVCAFPAFAQEEGTEPGAVDEMPVEDGEVVDVGVLEDGEVMPEEWIYMTGVPVDGEEVADGDVAVDDGTVVLEDGTVVTFDGVEGEEPTAEELMYYTTSAPESSVSVNAPDFVDASGISEVQIDAAFDGNSIVESQFDAPGEALSAPELPPVESGGARMQDGRLVANTAAPASN